MAPERNPLPSLSLDASAVTKKMQSYGKSGGDIFNLSSITGLNNNHLVDILDSLIREGLVERGKMITDPNRNLEKSSRGEVPEFSFEQDSSGNRFRLSPKT